jgi:hypothetical protein
VTPAPPHDIVRAVRAELAVPGRYHLQAAARPHQSLLGALFQWFWERWNSLWTFIAHHLRIGRGGASLIGDIVVVVCVLLIAAVAAHLLAQFQLEQARRARSVEVAPVRSAHALAVAAAQAAESGDYARAIRVLFMAVVTLLDLRGVVHDDRSATVNELRRALHERDGRLEPAFIEIARLYTSAAYAETPVDERAWRNARAAYDEVAASATA